MEGQLLTFDANRSHGFFDFERFFSICNFSMDIGYAMATQILPAFCAKELLQGWAEDTLQGWDGQGLACKARDR